MNTTDKVMSWLEGLAEPDWRDFHSDSEVQNIAKSALELLKSQRETIDELISDGKALKLLKEQEDLGTELTNAIELIHKKNERIKKLEEQIETLTKWRMNAGAFD